MNEYYIQYIQNLNIGSLNSKYALLSSKLKSTRFMTQLKHRFSNDIIDKNCEEAIDVLYLNLNIKYYNYGKLVIIYIPSEVRQNYQSIFDFTYRRMTFTWLKKQGISYWLRICKQEPYEKIELSNGTILKLWETPYELEAVTDYDKDFRKEWEDGWLAYEGNEYGDTSTFYIIGCIDA